MLARIYELYERQLAEQGIHDFDDLVRSRSAPCAKTPSCDGAGRAASSRCWSTSTRTSSPPRSCSADLAAPQDGFFCVGDEDQTLYGWRRASVRRIIDLASPTRVWIAFCLAHNYRCPEAVVDASRRLIERNAVRFPKPIDAARDRTPRGEPALRLREHADQPQGAEEIAARLADRRRDQVVVLARTTNLLRTVALACAGAGVRISAPEQVFEPHGARGALEAYLRLCAAPVDARPDEVAAVCRVPSRGLPLGAEERVARSLNAGLGFAASLTAVAAEGRQRSRLEDAGLILDALAAITDASRFVAFVRGAGGLDEYYRAHEQAFGDTERVDLEVLEEAQCEAAGRTVGEFAELLQARSDALAASDPRRRARDRADDDPSRQGARVAGGAPVRLRGAPASAPACAPRHPGGACRRRGPRSGAPPRLRRLHAGAGAVGAPPVGDRGGLVPDRGGPGAVHPFGAGAAKPARTGRATTGRTPTGRAPTGRARPAPSRLPPQLGEARCPRCCARRSGSGSGHPLRTHRDARSRSRRPPPRSSTGCSEETPRPAA